MPVLDDVLHDALALSDLDREILAARLVGTLRDSEPEVTAAWRSELLRRRANVDEGRVQLIDVSDDLWEIFDDD